MLQHLFVKNIALIDQVEIDFSDNLNILTGETGAGKSILIGSINIALGKRGSKELLREGAERGMVELLFQVNEKIEKEVKALGIECEGEVLISRVITNAGRSVSRVNGSTVTTQTVRQLASMLIDIHGQHEHQSLLDEQSHINLLDMFCKEDLTPMLTSLKQLLDEYNRFKQEKKSLSLNEDEKNRRLSMLEYEIKEIEEAGLRSDEEEQLLADRRKHLNSKRIYEDCCEVYRRLQGDFQSDEEDVISNMNMSLQLLNGLRDFDESLQGSFESLENALIWIQEVATDMRGYIDGIEHDGDTLETIENRLELINRLQRKYGDTVEKVLDYEEKARKEYDDMLHIEERLHNLDQEMKKLEASIEELCEKMSDIRHKTAKMLEEKIESMLKTLQFEYAEFKVEIERSNHYRYDGYDHIRFMITTNIGEPLRPLHNVASGGEMSRIMLAIKTILAEIDEIPTLIFDEVDTGISGRTAQRVAEKLAMIARYHQVLCITHLPQIAAMADEHLLIEKFSTEQKTHTEVKILNKDERSDELARLLGGAMITDVTLKNAREVQALAKRFKQNLK